MKTLLLVDGSSYLYRAFHALPDLRTKAGEPTGAIYGVLNMLRRLHKDVPADYSACVFDAKGKTFRDDWYPQYKATRTAMPDDLGSRSRRCTNASAPWAGRCCEIDGVEADDVIGTLALAGAKQGVRTVISSSDKDMTQLVDPHVTLVNTMSNETFDEAGVVEKFGVQAGADRRLPHPDRRQRGQHSRRGQGRPEDRLQLLAQYGTLDNLSRMPTRSPAWSAKTCARSRTGCRRRAGCSRSSATSSWTSRVEDLSLQPQDKPRSRGCSIASSSAPGGASWAMIWALSPRHQ